MFNDLQRKAVSFLSENSAAILTAGGVIGTAATAVLSGRACFKAAQIIDAEENKILQDSVGDPQQESTLTKANKAKLVAPQFIAPVLVGVATIAAIILANRVSAQRAAVLAAAYGVSSKQLDEYKAKLEEKLGVKKAEAIRDDIQQDRINERPPGNDVIIVGTGPVLCYDAFSDRYFKSTAEAIRKAERVVNGEVETGNECKLGVFYHELDLPQTMFDDMLGWNLDNKCKVVISAMMVKDDACLCLEFMNLPMPNYRLDYD